MACMFLSLKIVRNFQHWIGCLYKTHVEEISHNENTKFWGKLKMLCSSDFLFSRRCSDYITYASNRASSNQLDSLLIDFAMLCTDSLKPTNIYLTDQSDFTSQFEQL